MTPDVQPASFRDPAGFIFFNDKKLYRAVTERGMESYRTLMDTGLYDALTREKLIVPHQPAAVAGVSHPLVIEPERLPFISYPYEWCFSQLQDAALLTLRIQALAVEKGASLKDATPYNVQFSAGRPIFIDTLSFEAYRETPWVAYRQFCEMFLAPLAMMAYVEADYNRHLLTDLGGLRLAAVSRLLPLRSWLSPGLLAHVHLHAMGQKSLEDAGAKRAVNQGLRMPKIQHLALIDQLEGLVRGLKPFCSRTSFGKYYSECEHYTDAAEVFKAKTIEDWIREESYRTAVDLGANNGRYSRLLTRAGILTLALDSDASCVDENYRKSRGDGDSRMLPLVADVSNLSGGAGWDAREREPLFERFRPDLVMALAVIHHLRISAGVSMEFLARFFAGKSRDVILEFVPKSDPMVQRLLRSREDVFWDYDEAAFEAAFGELFTLAKKVPIPETHRTLYFLRKK